MTTTLTLPTESIAIAPWADPVIDTVGLDPRSSYVETFWLGVLGPSTTWLLRRLAAGLDDNPEGFLLDLGDTAAALGLGHRGGQHSPFIRSLTRCVQFGLAQQQGPDVLAVRRRVPPLNRRQVLRLPASLQEAHAAWQRQQLAVPNSDELRRRARQLALSMLELGEDVEATERQLHRWKFHPAVAFEASRWAWERHLAAATAAALDAAVDTAVAATGAAVSAGAGA